MTVEGELSDSLSEVEESNPLSVFFDPHIESNYPKVQNLIKNNERGVIPCDNGTVWKIPTDFNLFDLHEKLTLKPKLTPFLTKEDSPHLWLDRALNGFLDILFTGETWDNMEKLASKISLFSLNRIFNARDRILKNNAVAAEGKECRDQGFTRPRVLILLPFKSAVHRYVNTLIHIFETIGAQVENKSRFVEEYVLDEADLAEQNEALANKPEDYRNLFGGNSDDCFRLGIKVTRKSLKLFSEFYQSDIIISSPLGLKLSIEGVSSEQKDKKNQKKDKEDWDFLSSIEVLVVDQANVLLMQNWDHLNSIYDLLNNFPKDPSKTDFSRVKSAYLEGQADFMRQNIFISSYQFAELGNLFNKSKNIMGRVENHLEYRSQIKEFERIGVKLQMHPILCPEDLSTEPEARLNYFEQNIFPKLQKYHHVCIFVSSYFDFLRVCKFLKQREESTSYTFISEYSSPKETTKARAQFFNGHVKFLVTTERFHFYKRLRIRGIKKLFFYSLPECIDYFKEFVEMLRKSDAKVGRRFELPILVTQLDRFRLERLVGSDKMRNLFSD